VIIEVVKLKAKKVQRSKFIQGLRVQIEENPLAAVVAVGAILVGVAKVINALGHAKGSRAYAKQVNYRINRRG
jgi:hypothetical protein